MYDTIALIIVLFSMRPSSSIFVCATVGVFGPDTSTKFSR